MYGLRSGFPSEAELASAFGKAIPDRRSLGLGRVIVRDTPPRNTKSSVMFHAKVPDGSTLRYVESRVAIVTTSGYLDPSAGSITPVATVGALRGSTPVRRDVTLWSVRTQRTPML